MRAMRKGALEGEVKRMGLEFGRPGEGAGHVRKAQTQGTPMEIKKVRSKRTGGMV